jgi:RimJ/RimL family protein N-acetyltransferase
MHIINSERLRLISMTPQFLSASLIGKPEDASEAIGLNLPDEWLAESGLMDIRLYQLEQDPSLQPWLLRAVALRDEPIMIGHIGFHSQPGPDYLREYAPEGVEFGYTIYPHYQRQGYASEACAALMDWATADHDVHQFIVTIAPDNVPSQRIAQRFGFSKVGEYMDEVDGLEEIYLRQL